MKVEQIKALAKEIHEGNKKRGFWDNERPMSELLVLIRTEIDEAVDADRDGLHANMYKYKKLESKLKYEHFPKDLFVKYIRNTVEEELADTVIRILDLAASGMIDGDIFYKFLSSMDGYYATRYDCETFIDMVDEFHETMPSRKTKTVPMCFQLGMSLLLVLHYCTINTIDIWGYVKEKLKYNTTRPYKHGKKY